MGVADAAVTKRWYGADEEGGRDGREPDAPAWLELLDEEVGGLA